MCAMEILLIKSSRNSSARFNVRLSQYTLYWNETVKLSCESGHSDTTTNRAYRQKSQCNNLLRRHQVTICPRGRPASGQRKKAVAHWLCRCVQRSSRVKESEQNLSSNTSHRDRAQVSPQLLHAMCPGPLSCRPKKIVY